MTDKDKTELAIDQKLAELENFIAESNEAVTSALAYLDENKKRLEALGITQETLSQIKVSEQDYHYAVQTIKQMGYGHLLESEEVIPAKSVQEPDEHQSRVAKNTSRHRFNMI